MFLFDQFVARRKAQRRELKKIQRFQEADVLVVSHGKSGRTWMRTLVSSLYHQKYGIPETQLIHFDNFHLRNRSVPKILFTDNVVAPLDTAGARARPPSTTQNLILLTRDPRDIAVSFYFQLAKRSTEIEKLRKGIDDEIADMPIYDFMVNQNLGVLRVIKHMNSWEGHLDNIHNYIRINYEDLVSDPVAALGRVAKFVGGDFSEDEIRRAVEFGSFESMKEKERQGFFETDRLRPTNDADPDSFKVRRGKVGGYRDYFTAEQLKTIDRIMETQLSPFYGYKTVM